MKTYSVLDLNYTEVMVMVATYNPNSSTPSLASKPGALPEVWRSSNVSILTINIHNWDKNYDDEEDDGDEDDDAIDDDDDDDWEDGKENLCQSLRFPLYPTLPVSRRRPPICRFTFNW